MSSFSFPDGVEYLGEDSEGLVRFKVSIPTDDEGFLGRECPSCEQHFRIADEDYEALPDEVHLWCVYCGHLADHSDFLTQQQHDRIMRAASDYATQMVGRALDQSFGRTSGGRRGSMVRISYRSKPFYPEPLPGIDEERLVRERACAACGLRYAIFGEHRFCPVCGLLPPLIAALDALAAESVRLDALSSLPDDVRSELRESGVLDRTYVDTIENAVGVVEATTSRIAHESLPDIDLLLKGKGKLFQRLNDLADFYALHLNADLRSILATSWDELEEAWAARHVFTHCDGIVDQKYLAAVPASPMRPGQRLRVSESLARSTIAGSEKLCRAAAGEQHAV